MIWLSVLSSVPSATKADRQNPSSKQNSKSTRTHSTYVSPTDLLDSRQVQLPLLSAAGVAGLASLYSRLLPDLGISFHMAQDSWEHPPPGWVRHLPGFDCVPHKAEVLELWLLLSIATQSGSFTTVWAFLGSPQ